MKRKADNGRLKVLADLFITFAKIGLFTVGGGYAMLPIMQHQVVDEKHWVDEGHMADFMTMAQAAPGIISINTATAVGHHVGGSWGSLAATLGMVTPSFIIILCIAVFLGSLKDIEVVAKAFQGIRAAVVALMFHAVFRLTKTGAKDMLQWMILTVSAVAVVFFKFLPQYVLVSAAVFGVLWGYLQNKRKGKKGHDGAV